MIADFCGEQTASGCNDRSGVYKTHRGHQKHRTEIPAWKCCFAVTKFSEGESQSQGAPQGLVEVSEGCVSNLVQASGSLPERQVAMLVYEVLRLVRCCHSANILHGDIKVHFSGSFARPPPCSQLWTPTRAPVRRVPCSHVLQRRPPPV